MWGVVFARSICAARHGSGFSVSSLGIRCRCRQGRMGNPTQGEDHRVNLPRIGAGSERSGVEERQMPGSGLKPPTATRANEMILVVAHRGRQRGVDGTRGRV